MLLLAALLAASAPPSPPAPESRATTRVTVRIVHGAGVRGGRVVGSGGGILPTRSQIRIADPETGSRTLSLVEFP